MICAKKISGIMLLWCCFALLPLETKATVAVTAAFVPQEEVHYKAITISAQDEVLIAEGLGERAGKIKVVEFFSYGCHWCFHLEPTIATWLKTKPAHIDFYRIPVTFQPAWRPLTRMYFATEGMGLQNKVHVPMFKAIADGVIQDTKDETIFAFVEKEGIDKTAFIKAYHSFAVENRYRWANNMAKVYKIMVIPTLLIIGPHKTYYTNTALAGDEEKVLQILKFLAQQESQAMQKTKVKKINKN